MFNLSALSADIRHQIESSPKYTALFARWPDTLLGVDNAKTVKGNKKGFRTAILYLAPHKLSGVNLCPMADVAGCVAACLNTAGRGAMSNVQMARLRKTLAFHQDRERFVAQLIDEVGRLKLAAARDGVTLLVRPNGTSDIEWERVAPELFFVHSDVQFYDYTKIPNRRELPDNYDLTFSHSGVQAFAKHTARARLSGIRVAVVFDRREGIPATFEGMQCVDGDDSDIRHLDAQGVAVALYAKGTAKHDTSGFVIRT